MPVPIPVTTLYLAVFAVFGSVLSFLPAQIRGRTGVSIGDAGNPQLLLAMRRHGNFLEYVPYFMTMMLALELNGASATSLHALGGAMVAARVAHALGLKSDSIESIFRLVGAGGTLLLTLVATAMLVLQWMHG